MRLKAIVIPCVVIVLGALLTSGCGKGKGKRPGTLTNPGATSDRSYPPTETLDTGSGVERLPDDGISGSNLNINDDGSGGPLADVRFEFGSAALTPAAEGLLRNHASWLRDNPRTSAMLEGHCDERGTVDYNLALGEQRARAVYEFLTGLGLPATRFRPVSFGKERPLEGGQTEEAYAKNRRVHFAISGS